MRTGQILSQLPSLRRYAGFLTGSDEKGDALVTATLEGILAGKIALCADAELRIALFRALHDVWEPPDEISVKSSSGVRHRGDRFEDIVSPIERAVLILTRLEGLFVSEAGYVLRMDVGIAQRRLDWAESKLEHLLDRRILIVEDNILLAMELEELIASLGHRPIGPATTRAEAVNLAMRKRPHLILSDIQLRDGTSGIDAVDRIRHDIDIPVIYLTAFPNQLGDRRHEPDSYVVPKPFSNSLIRSFITNALLRHGVAH